MGRFDRDDRAAVYDQFDVLVVPSLWLENSPLVIHEAFMAGVPVVGSRIGGIPDLVEEGISGLLVDPGSPEALAQALETLAADRPRLEAMTAAARGEVHRRGRGNGRDLSLARIPHASRAAS